MSFRDHTPVRRNITRQVTSHRDHRDDLKTDFHTRCGYCNALDKRKLEYFHVDHFVPQNPKGFTHDIPSTAYYNLIYACGSCNRAKSNKWPTLDPKVPNRNDEGFIDPCDQDYNNHFSRSNTGEINHKSDLGKWIYHELKFHKPQHSIIWNLEKLESLIAEIKLELAKSPDQIIERRLKDRLIEAYDLFMEYIDKLDG